MLPSPTADGDALDRAQAHVAAREDAGDARFEQVGIAVARPAPGLHHVVAGQDIAARVARDLRRQPLGLRVGADEDEQAAAVVPAHLAVAPSRMSIAVRWCRRASADFGAQRDLDVRLAPQLLDQVVRHALLQGIAAHDQRHRARMVGKVQRRLTGRVAGADQVDVEPWVALASLRAAP